MMKISVSSYSFYQYIRDGKMTQFDAVDKAHQLGFDAVEFIDLTPCENPTLKQQKEYAEKIRKRADELGMTINAYTIGATMFHKTREACDAEVKRLCEQLDVAKILGATVLRHDVVGSLSENTLKSFDLMLPVIAENTIKVTEYAQTLGIKTCSENHGYVAQDSDRVERLYNAVNHENYGILVDFGNFSCVDEDNVTAVSRVAPYAVHVHCKDMHLYPGTGPKPEGASMTRGGNFFMGAVIGEGDVPVKQCLRIMKRAGYDGFASVEYEGKEDCITGISRGLSNLKAFMKDIEEEFK